MSVRQVRKEEYTKDGRSWIYEARFNGKTYKSKKYKNKKEAQQAEREFLVNADSTRIENSKMTFEELRNKHFNDQLSEVKETTVQNYRNKNRHLEYLNNYKVVDLNLRIIKDWKDHLNEVEYDGKKLKTRTKNDILKYLKSILNYGHKMYKFDFSDFYYNITNFNNKDEAKEEMKFYTYEEFIKYLAVENDLMYICLFEILYYCGLRRGELLGLTWKDIDFNFKKLTVRNNVVSVKNQSGGYWKITTPKTPTSSRSILIPAALLEHLKELKAEKKQIYGFNDSWFIAGDIRPIADSTLRKRNNDNAAKAGLQRIRIHDFRHSCASLLINSGANILNVAKYLGHSKKDITLNTYGHMFENSSEEVVNVINNLDSKLKLGETH